MSAYENVFGILELAEAILLELPMRDLLCGAQQVCRQWKAIIETSSALQKSLFLKPVTSTTLAEVIEVFEDGEERETGEWASSTHEGRYMRASAIYEHPYLLSIYDLWGSDDDRSESDAVEALRLFRRLSKSTAKWRHHLLTQPPICEMEIRDFAWCDKTISSSMGITLGHLWDCLVNLEERPMKICGWNGWKTYHSYHELRAVRLLEHSKLKVVNPREVSHEEEDSKRGDPSEGGLEGNPVD
jgi:hypothetical protein